MEKLEDPVLVSAQCGQFWVLPSDTAIGASLLQKGCFEEKSIGEVTNFLINMYSFCPRQFVDIGANIGTHLIHALREVGFETGIAIEAEPVNYNLLVRNIRQNNLENRVRSFHYAVSNRAGVVTLEQAADNRGDHRIRSLYGRETSDLYNESTRRTLCLVSESLDNLDAEHQLGIGPHSLIWMDTQGHEGQVLEGAKSLIANGRVQFLVCEFWPYGLERASGKQKLFHFLMKCGAVYDLRSPNWPIEGRLSRSELDRKYEELLQGGTDHTDLLCISKI
jgi:FkbM family methyltransferase